VTVQFELTNADGGEEADGGVGRVAVREERLGGVHGEGEGHDGLAAGPHDDALHPQPARQERAPWNNKLDRHQKQKCRHLKIRDFEAGVYQSL
jgi:hypothetical protein